jgi:hypothetical protein
MRSLVDLPTEVRQRIVFLAIDFPDTLMLDKPFPRNILDFLHINFRLRLDTAHLISKWSPIHYISQPTQLTKLPLKPPSITINTTAYTPRLHRICLDLFHDSQVNRITWTCYCVRPEYYSHPELIAAWASIVHLLPIQNIDEVYLDVTPAPGSKRPGTQHRIITHPFLYDKRVQTFLTNHIADVTALLNDIHAHYSRKAKIGLTGSLSDNSRLYISALQREFRLDEIYFEGEWVTIDHARFAKIDSAVERIVSKQAVQQAVSRGEKHPLAWLRAKQWGKDVKWVYAKIADQGDEDAAVQDLRILVDFVMDEERKEVKFAPGNSDRRAFQHRVAKGLGALKSESVGDGDERHVLVRKVEKVIRQRSANYHGSSRRVVESGSRA